MGRRGLLCCWPFLFIPRHMAKTRGDTEAAPAPTYIGGGSYLRAKFWGKKRVRGPFEGRYG